MLYGQVPFKSSKISDLHHAILSGEYTLKENISKDSRDLIKHLLDINPTSRFQYEEIKNHRWVTNIIYNQNSKF